MTSIFEEIYTTSSLEDDLVAIYLTIEEVKCIIDHNDICNQVTQYDDTIIFDKMTKINGLCASHIPLKPTHKLLLDEINRNNMSMSLVPTELNNLSSACFHMLEKTF